MGASPVASGPPAARGAPERSGSLPVSLARPEKPVWLAPLWFRNPPSSPVLNCPRPISDNRWAPEGRQRPKSRTMGAALRPARPVREGASPA